MEEKLDTVLDEARKSMRFPASAWAVWEAAADPDTSSNRLAGIMERDPSLAAQVLRIANSAAYGQVGRVADLPHGIRVLGTQKVAELALIAGCSHGLNKNERRMLRHMDFWEHSFACAQLARTLAPTFGLPGNVAFAAALLHDIGYLVLFATRPDDMTEVFQIAMHTSRPTQEVEAEYFGFDHASMGEALLQTWSLPADICEAVGRHHSAKKSAELPLSALVYLANRGVNLAEGLTNETGETADDETQQVLSTRLGCDREALPGFLERLQERASELRETVGPAKTRNAA